MYNLLKVKVISVFVNDKLSFLPQSASHGELPFGGKCEIAALPESGSTPVSQLLEVQ